MTPLRPSPAPTPAVAAERPPVARATPAEPLPPLGGRSPSAAAPLTRRVNERLVRELLQTFRRVR